MAAIKRKFYILSVGGVDRKIKLPEYYSEINTQLGMTEAPADSAAELITTQMLLSTGRGVKIRTRRKLANLKYATIDLVCLIGNAATAMSALLGKNVGTATTAGVGEIKSAYFPHRSRLG